MVSSFQYRAFGQVIASEFPIDVLEPAPDETPTLQVRLASGLRRGRQAEDPFFDITPQRQFFEWAAVGAFEITDPSCIFVDPRPDVSWRLVSQPLLGIVISVALERLGLFCLHGGSVDVNGKAVIVLGDKGAGKSTTVSSLQRAGHRLLTDDLVAMDCGDLTRAPQVQTGFPAVKLWPDSAKALAVDTETGTELIHPSITKIQKQIDPTQMARPTPAGAIFLLSPRQTGETRAERVPETSALEALLYFAFIARFGNTSLGPAHLGQFMKRCCYVVKTTPVYTLHIRRDLDRLSDLVAEIDRQVMELS
ncbi:HPr kinase/phosphorylase [Tritonibacter horizontis]|uniref:HPr kinase/phosphorylase n=1 Tax=Tritonibacter horizontis TaxID=1768241 RepID=A0A132BZN9_9RHOB|nr:HPr kinase/phosphorylase [Tritonibacter horizontis]